jgi:hypothetical protein
MRIKANEITYTRIKEAVLRRLENIPQNLEWNTSSYNGFKKSNLSRFHNLHTGKRCFLLANGPSLKHTDLSLLKNEITLGMNRIYLLFDELKFHTTYYTVSNELVLTQFANDIEHLPGTKFVNWNCRKLFKSEDMNYLKMNLSIKDKFSKDIIRGVYSGGTITFASLQLLYYMGFSEVVIVGMDHNFTDKGLPNKTEVRTAEVDANHFHPDYFPKGMKWQLPDLYRSELAYYKAKVAFEADGRRILDATKGGHCTVFEKVDYQSLFIGDKI